MNGGKWFRKHKNKSDDESYGNVVFSYFNPKMHRIEVIVEYDLDKDDWTKDSIEKNIDIQTSMGTTINYDICNVCHPNWRQFYKVDEEDMKTLADTKDEKIVEAIVKKYGLKLSFTDKFNSGGGLMGIAKDGTRYCIHIKNELGRYLSNWQKVVMVNLRPKLFDISFVSVNADKSSFVLAKVASDKNSDDKKSEMTKEVPTENLSDDSDEIINYFDNVISPALRATEEELPNKVLDEMASKNTLEEILSSFLAIGSFPKNREMQRILVINMGNSPDYADELERNGHIINDDLIEEMSELPRGMELDLG
jgi:ribosomal protein L31